MAELNRDKFSIGVVLRSIVPCGLDYVILMNLPDEFILMNLSDELFLGREPERKLFSSYRCGGNCFRTNQSTGKNSAGLSQFRHLAPKQRFIVVDFRFQISCGQMPIVNRCCYCARSIAVADGLQGLESLLME